MKLYNNFMYDAFLIFLYYFLLYTQNIWIEIFFYYITSLITIIKKFYYIPTNYNLKLINCVIIYNSIIIYAGPINLNYYHFRILKSKFIIFPYLHKIEKYFKITGNSNYIVIDDLFYKLNEKNTHYFTKSLQIYKLPIHKFDKEECCICYDNDGSLFGLCGHQNICKECSINLESCPTCNCQYTINKKLLTNLENM